MSRNSLKSAYSKYKKSILKEQKRLIRSKNISNILNAMGDTTLVLGALAQYGQNNLEKRSLINEGAKRAHIIFPKTEKSFWDNFKLALKSPDMSDTVYGLNKHKFTNRELYQIGRLQKEGILDLYLNGSTVYDIFGSPDIGWGSLK